MSAILLSALPLLAPPIPPMLDVPAAMARYHVMLGGGDAAILGQWYKFGWRPIGYLGADLLVAAIGPWLGLDLAVKCVALAIPMLAAAGILWISREAHGRVQPLALAALPLAYNFAFVWGFLNFTLAMALTLNAFALWLRLGRLGRFRLRALLFVPIAWLVWTAHLFGWLVLGLLAFAAELMRQRGSGRGWVDAFWRASLGCLPLALPFVMFLLWRPSDGNAQSDYLPGLIRKPTWLAMVLRDRWQWFDIGSTVLLALLLYRALRARGRQVAPPLAAAAIGLFAAFLFLPFGSAYIDARLAPYLLIIALLAVRIPARESRAIALIGLAFFVARTAASTVSLWIESQDWRRHLAVIDQIPRGARVATFVTNACPQSWRAESRNHLPSFLMIRRAAFANDQFSLGSTGLLSVVAPQAAGYAMDPSQIVTADPCPEARDIRTLEAALKGLPRAAFDYVWLIDAPTVDPRLFSSMHLVAQNGADRLYRIDTHPTG